MDLDFNGDVASLDAELLQLPEVSPLAIKANPFVAEKLFDQWLSLPETNSLVIVMFAISFFILQCGIHFSCLGSACLHLLIRLGNFTASK